MSASKYANLPDIDINAPDVYETGDVFPTNSLEADSTDEESSTFPSRNRVRGAGSQPATAEELDSTHLIGSEEATKRFRKAERKRASRPQFEYPRSPSPSASSSTVRKPADGDDKPPSLAQRLKNLKAELTSLETELADPSNERVHKEWKEDNVDPGELIRDLVQLRTRLLHVSKGKEGRGRLVEVVTADEPSTNATAKANGTAIPSESNEQTPGGSDLTDMDRRVAQLERIIGSTSTTLDEASPLPPAILPQVSRLSAQMTLLSQPRHIDSISRRLKLLLSDLERVSAAQSQPHHSHHRSNSSNEIPTTTTSKLPEQMMPILTRLGPLLPQIPHILTRLRTLSALHSSAASFSSDLNAMEIEQKRLNESLLELQKTVESVEKNLEENKTVVKSNVTGLEDRIEQLLRRLDALR